MSEGRKKTTRRASTTRRKPATARTAKPATTRRRKDPAPGEPTPILTVKEPLAQLLPEPEPRPVAAEEPVVTPATRVIEQPELPQPEPVQPPTQLEPRGEVMSFEPSEWVAVTYEGEEMFVHPRAGIFVRGTTTRLRGTLATELAEAGAFRLRRAG
ncbi:MAG: hypothetical protein AB7N76_21125 [Planctomycetota bacterium]